MSRRGGGHHTELLPAKEDEQEREVKTGGKRIWRREMAEGGAAQLQQPRESWRRGGRRLRRRGARLEDGWELVAVCVSFFTVFCFSTKPATQIRKTHCHKHKDPHVTGPIRH
jgi:hypothetical protein